jgi:hypothetical protein
MAAGTPTSSGGPWVLPTGDVWSSGGSSATGEALSAVGWFGSWAGTGLSAVGAFYGAKSQKDALAAEASAMEFAGSMADIEARGAEQDAQAIIDAGHREKAMLTYQQGQDRAAVEVAQAGSGTTGGGSNAEVRASQRLLQQLDVNQQNVNTVRAAYASRLRATDLRNQGSLARVSASNRRSTARSIDPYLAGTSSLLSSTGTLANQWVWRESRNQRYR